MNKPFIITFAGPPGTSKTPIAMYLSHTFRLPIIQMDAIRMEVREDLSIDSANDPRVKEEFLKRAYARYQPLLQERVCFIDDSSADRSWKQNPDDQYYQLARHGYDYFIISMDLSKSFIDKLHAANKSYSRSDSVKNYEDHQAFLRQYDSDVSVHVDDKNFNSRMTICTEAFRSFLITH